MLVLLNTRSALCVFNPSFRHFELKKKKSPSVRPPPYTDDIEFVLFHLCHFSIFLRFMYSTIYFLIKSLIYEFFSAGIVSCFYRKFQQYNVHIVATGNLFFFFFSIEILYDLFESTDYIVRSAIYF